MRNHFLRAIQKTAAPTTDPNFKQVALLLHGDGTNGSQNQTFVDSSTNNFSITRNGNATQGTYSPFSLPNGQWSNFFDGNGDFFTIPSNAAFDQNAGDWTIESWVYLTASVNATFGTVVFGQEFTRQVKLAISNTGVAVLDQAGVGPRVTGTTVLQVGQWYHLAAVRNGSTLSLYVNGVSEGTPNTTTTFAASGNTIHIARRPDVAYFLTGYISNLRFVKGTALYTANFTPPTTGLTAISGTSLLTCQSNMFVDNSSNNFTLTRNGDVRVTAFSPFAPTSAYSPSVNGASGYFDGTGDYLSVADSTALEVPTEDFTVEFWAYYTVLPSSGANANTFQKGIASGSTFEYAFGITNSSGTVRVRAGYSTNGSTTTNFVATSGTIVTNTWYHIAFTRTGTTLNLWLNGVNVGSTTSYPATLFTGTGTLGIGASPNNASLVNGYISNARIVKGTALYTANFTPPTAPLTAITNTSLLLNFTNAGIVDSAAKNVIETVGNAQISTSVTKFGTGSLAFDGNGDYLTIPARPETLFGTSPFTVEFWYYPTDVSTQRGMLAKGTSGASTNWQLEQLNTGVLRFYHNNLTTFSCSTSLSANTWYHVAIVGNRTSIVIYLNGVQDGSVTYTYNYSDNSVLRVGVNRGTSSYVNGYIDDLRITNGVARYTADFTPPSAPYPDL